MAGMFYSLQEAIEKLNKTEEEIKQIVAEGKLREFRDGANLLFKVEEVEALMADSSDAGLEEILEPETAEPEAVEFDAPEPLDLEPDALEIEDLEPDTLELDTADEEPAEADFPDLDVAEAGDSAADLTDLESLESEMAEVGGLEPDAPSDAPSDTDEILLAPETGVPAIDSDLTDADTAITSLGTNVLGETDADYDITDDTMAETAIPMGTAGTTPEVPLEEIEEDVNLDSFGSGSGLLDLSLQADDTSLGGILDEIYTAEDEVAEPMAADDAEAGEAVGLVAEVEDMAGDEDLAAPDMAAAAAPALARPFIEAPPDAQSNTLGMLLFLPLLIVIYTTAVAVSGLRGVMPSILASVQNFIWYMMGGAVALTAVIAGAAFLLTGERDATAKKVKAPKKAKKAKKVKEPKKPKEKKPKKEKKAKKKK